jgi:cytochrome c biogenesis protein
MAAWVQIEDNVSKRVPSMSEKARVSANYTESLWKFFASVKLTVVVLLTLAILSIVGTLIPQNQSPADYFNAFGPFLYQVLSVLDIFDMYHSWWFQFLMLLLVVNIVVCSVERLRLTGKMIFTRSPKFNLNNYRRSKSRREFIVDDAAESNAERYASLLTGSFRYCRVAAEGQGFAITAEKGRWTRLGVYGVHLSVVILLVGSLLGSISGFEGFASIPEGQSVNVIQLRNTGLQHQLPFSIRCDDFDVQFYETGAPKEFRSKLTIIEGGQPVLTKEIIVNDPLRYKGINIFQSSYGKMDADPQTLGLPEEIELNFKSVASGMIYKRTTGIGKAVKLPEGLGEFVVDGYDPDGKFRGMAIGPALTGTLTPPQGTPVPVVLAMKFPKFDMMRKGEVVISVASETIAPETKYYTGLQITSDPGVGVVYTGFIMMILGCIVAFFMSHQQLVVELQPKGKKTTVLVSGKANKNRIGFQAKLDRLSDRLTKLASHRD